MIRPFPRDRYVIALFISVALHVLVLAGTQYLRFADKLHTPEPEDDVTFLDVRPAPAQPTRTEPPAPTLGLAPAARVPQDNAVKRPPTDHPPASMAAPPAPTAEEWALASKYTLKNSKRYRYTWGQQVRSMMGTAVEGPDQGVVRFRIEIAPDGTLTRLDTLWTTSAVAEQLARKAIQSMPPLPPTPTGKPLIFEKTISFQPFATDDPPLYKNDCLPDPPAFRNPFAWDGQSARGNAAPAATEKPSPEALAECLRQLPQDSIEAEAAHDRRQQEQWGSDKLGR